jgi:hypothetical protein
VHDLGRAPKNVRKLSVEGCHLVLLFGENTWHFVLPERILGFGTNSARLSKVSNEMTFVHAIQAAKAANFERFVMKLIQVLIQSYLCSFAGNTDGLMLELLRVLLVSLLNETLPKMGKPTCCGWRQ